MLFYMYVSISGHVLLLGVLQSFRPGPERDVQDAVRSKAAASAKDPK